jgi:hypothetical protein
MGSHRLTTEVQSKMEIWLNRYCFGIANKVFNSKQQAEDSAVFDGFRHLYIGAVKADCVDQEIIDDEGRGDVALFSAKVTRRGEVYSNTGWSMQQRLQRTLDQCFHWDNLTYEELMDFKRQGYSIKVFDRKQLPWAEAMRMVEKRFKDE